MNHQHIFRGRRLMKGRGLGSIFGKIFRSSVPYLKSIGKYATKQLLQAGNDTIRDLDSGMKLKDSILKNKRKTKNRIISDIKKKMTGNGKKRKLIKRKRKQRKQRKYKQKKSKKNKRKRKNIKKKEFIF